MENILISANSVLPTFIMLLVGLCLQKTKLVPEHIYPYFSRLSYHVMLPALMFNSVYAAPITTAFSPRLLLFLVCEILTIFSAAMLIFGKTVTDPKKRGTYIQCTFRANIGGIGIALSHTLMDNTGTAMMALCLAVISIEIVILAVIALESCRGGKPALHTIFRSVIRNPMVIGILTGVLVNLSGIVLPDAITSTIEHIGRSGTVLVLLALGASFRFDRMAQNMKDIFFCSAMRLILIPTLVLTIAMLMGFRGNELCVILLFVATPIPSAAYAMAVGCDSDHELISQVMVLTSALCSITLFLFIFVLKQLTLI